MSILGCSFCLNGSGNNDANLLVISSTTSQNLLWLERLERFTKAGAQMLLSCHPFSTLLYYNCCCYLPCDPVSWKPGCCCLYLSWYSIPTEHWNCSLIPSPRPAFRHLHAVLQAMESWAGPGNEATRIVNWDLILLKYYYLYVRWAFKDKPRDNMAPLDLYSPTSLMQFVNGMCIASRKSEWMQIDVLGGACLAGSKQATSPKASSIQVKLTYK